MPKIFETSSSITDATAKEHKEKEDFLREFLDEERFAYLGPPGPSQVEKLIMALNRIEYEWMIKERK